MSAQELPATQIEAARALEARPTRPMDTHLRLRGLTADGTRLQLVDPSGLEFTVEIDARLRAALHGDPARGPQNDRQPTQTTPTRGGTVEKTMENILRPREIQARIRAGETPEAIANAAHTTLDKVMPYAAPVLAEREHVAQRALRASVRRAGGEASSAARTLGEAVSTRLRSMNVDPDSVLWDAWRREDGRWSLTANFNAAEVEGLAELTFDQRGNFVILDNDQARWLVGDRPEVPSPGLAPEPEPTARALSAVPSEQLSLSADDLGADALELVREPLDDQASTQDLSETVAAIRAVAPEPANDPSSEHLAEPLTEQTVEQAPVSTAEPEAAVVDEAPPARPARKSRARASVPSWDEILFGGADKPS